MNSRAVFFDTGVCGKFHHLKCYPPGSPEAMRQHKTVCTGLYPKVTPHRYIAVVPTSNIYHEHAVVNFRYWYQEKKPPNQACRKFRNINTLFGFRVWLLC